MKRFVMCAVLLLLSASVYAAEPCVFGGARVEGRLQSPQEYSVVWDAVPSARAYIVLETIAGAREDGRFTTTQFVTDQTSVQIRHEAIQDITYQYQVRALGNTGECSGGVNVKTFGDPVLRRAVRRGIVPIAGSTRGANGALFKTYLSLEGTGLHGKVIFHPAGRVASDDDPSIEYDLRSAAKVEWDDVVAAIGQSGVGSLSIVPAEGEVAQLPRATVRLYNVASNGIFGTNAEMYPGVGFLEGEAPFQKFEVPADGNFRANVGVRAIMGGTVHGFAITKEGGQKQVIERTFAAGETVFGSPEAVYGVSLEPGEGLLLTFTRAMIPFYTLTDNRTNDPFLYVQGVEREDVVDRYAK